MRVSRKKTGTRKAYKQVADLAIKVQTRNNQANIKKSNKGIKDPRLDKKRPA